MLLFLFLVAFNNFFANPVHNENSRLRLTLAIPIGTPITVAKDAIETPPLVTDLLSFLLSNSLSLISAIK